MTAPKFCPEGHDSVSQDYCDICGSPMESAPAAMQAEPSTPAPAPAAEGPATAASSVVCPHCGTRNNGANLFCESCGYDFTTGALPERIPLADGTYLPTPASTRTDAGAVADAPTDSDEGEPVRGNEPAADNEPGDDAKLPSDVESAPAADGDASDNAAANAERPVPAPRPAPAPRPSVAPTAEHELLVDASERSDRPTYRPPTQGARSGWVAEVWIDPEWFDLQEGEGSSPSPGPPDIVVLRSGGAVIGRPSASRGFRPEVDCGTDSAVSRRHARLSTDGRRWWIEDLDSSNGTFVGDATETPPVDPITPGRRVEIDADDRIWLGAWTRIVVRPATDSDRSLV